jgi:parallel beta-helix repeat protein
LLYYSSNYNIVSVNTATNNSYCGIYLDTSSSYNNVSGNTATANSYHGILLYSSSSNTVSGNNATANTYEGIYLSSTSHNTVSWNTVRNNSDSGIYLYSYSNYNIVSENNATANGYHGILLASSSNNNMISGNNATANKYEGIFLMSSSNYNTVSGNILTNNAEGIYLLSSSNNTVSRNTATANHAGILLWSSNNNIISENDATANVYQGIEVDSSSSYNSITGNNITANNGNGILFDSSSNNIIYRNNFVNNTHQIGSFNSTNTWDNGYPSGGNYWSDYTGTDVYRGAYQNVTGSDGIGDTHYTIDTNNTDNYPLMGTFGSPTPQGENVTVFPTEGVDLTFDNVTSAGSTTADRVESAPPPPLGFIPIGQYYEIIVTAQYSDNITIRIVYDDSNMTQQEEDSLQLSQWCPEVCDVTSNVTGVPDGTDNMRDIGYFANRFMTNSSSPNWDPRCDVTGPTPNVPDGVVNMRDIGMAATHFGSQSQWMNITLFVDTANNLIFGETTHFSLIGIHKGE